MDAKALLKQKSYILKSERIRAVEIDEKQKREDMHTNTSRCGNISREKCHAKEI
jgi:hypothetical protein